MTNHLISETSPYLVQHSHNPVDWYPWGEEALEKAHREDKPIFLSIGYAACHWCHVMAHESFEDPETASLMNAHFVNIKVDREERPDLDSIYMNAVVSLTGQGGWPMSVFLTPDGKPFYGGTYFPPVSRYGMPGFKDVLVAINRVWHEDREKTSQVSAQLVEHIRLNSSWGSEDSSPLRIEDLQTAISKLISSYDWKYGGWGSSPRFPAPLTIEFLLQQGSRGQEEPVRVAVHALETMQRGGMYDIIGGGFHRYSTDDHWLVPHFEKMLYDNAQLAQVYLHAYLLTGEDSFRHTCEETLDFLLREMTHPLGGFYSSLDADSDGKEGLFYIWSAEEIEKFLKDKGELDLFLKMVKVTPGGNFEGRNILQRRYTEKEIASELSISVESVHQRFENIRSRLYEARSKRIRPETDDKILVAWNSMALKVLAEVGRSLNRDDYLQAAQKNADFLLNNLYFNNRLHRAWRDGRARHNAYLEDYAALCLGLQALYQADGNTHWYDWAVRLAEEFKTNFNDPEGGFFDTRHDHGSLVVRPKGIQDNAVPSGNSTAVVALLHLAEYAGDLQGREEVEKVVAALKPHCLEYPTAFPFWLQALDFAVGPIQQIALVWPAEKARPVEFLNLFHRSYRPRAVLAAGSIPFSGVHPELLLNRVAINDQATAYVCQTFVCLKPTTSLVEFQSQLDQV